MPSPAPVLQVLSSLLLSKENVLGWPRVVVEDVVRQARRLRNEMFVMGGKIQGKPLLPLPEHLDSRDGSSTVLDWWVPPAGIPLGGHWLLPCTARGHALAPLPRSGTSLGPPVLSCTKG